jgi:hypothetical protein
MSEQTPPGWYPDPEDASHQRYWDGTAWTDHRTPATPQWGQAQQPAQQQWGQQQPAQWTPTGPVAPPTPGSATAALVLGIVSIVMCLGLFTGIPAMIVGRNAKREIEASGGRLGGEGVATAGVITGLIGTILSVLVILFFVLVIVGIAGSATA